MGAAAAQAEDHAASVLSQAAADGSYASSDNLRRAKVPGIRSLRK
jgi:hypothetical protein